MAELAPQTLAEVQQQALRFGSAKPFRHVVIDGFFAPDFAARLLDSFPPFERGNALNEAGLPGLKSTVDQIATLGGAYAQLDSLIQTPAFLGWLGEVTGIAELKYDPHYFGGGTHENRPGQDLDVHIDFNRHPVTGWHRRLNLIVYLNPEWDPAWGGCLELHSDPRQPDTDRIEWVVPTFNRCVIFETTEHSWHGFTRIVAPPERPQLSRRSVALYFYSRERPAAELADTHSTIYVDRPLPDRFQPGLKLSQADVDELRALWDRRMQHTQMLYRDLQALQVQLDRALASRVGSRSGVRRWVGSVLRRLGLRSAPAVASPQLEAPVAAETALLAPLPICPTCEQPAEQTVVGVVDPTHGAAFHVACFQLVECAGCQSVYLDPRPTPDDLRALYQDAVQFSDGTYTDPQRIAAMLEYYGGALRNHQLLPPAGGRMLEVGAGFAWVARACKALAPQVTTIAQDVTAECAERCPWVDQYLLGEIDVAQAHGPFQLISLTHVIEHLVSPMQALGRLAGLLAPGGHLFVTAPYRPPGWRSGDGIAPWLGYSYLHVPAHISYLTRAWFEQAARRWGLVLKHFDPSHDGQQAFEAVLTRT